MPPKEISLDEEPGSETEVQGWIELAHETLDRFQHVAEETERHRAAHGCNAYHSGDGPLLGVLARAAEPARVLEVGTALGYSALWIAFAARKAIVETIESDREHVALARGTIARQGYADRITVLEGRAEDILPSLRAKHYDLVFYDADFPGPSELDQFHRILRRRGLLISANIFPGRHPNMGGLERATAYRKLLLEDPWLTAFAGSHKMLSVRS